jgi:hypothetical protein
VIIKIAKFVNRSWGWLTISVHASSNTRTPRTSIPRRYDMGQKTQNTTSTTTSTHTNGGLTLLNFLSAHFMLQPESQAAIAIPQDYCPKME